MRIIKLLVVTHADASRMSIAIICGCDSVCLHNKFKTAENTTAKRNTSRFRKLKTRTKVTMEAHQLSNLWNYLEVKR